MGPMHRLPPLLHVLPLWHRHRHHDRHRPGGVLLPGVVPEGLARTTENIRTSGNQMAMANEDWVETCDWMAEEYGEEVYGLEIPVDKQGAEYMYTVNPREPMYYPQDVGMAAEIFHVAGLDWTVPSTGWDSTNLAMFAGDRAVATIPVKAMYDKALELGSRTSSSPSAATPSARPSSRAPTGWASPAASRRYR